MFTSLSLQSGCSVFVKRQDSEEDANIMRHSSIPISPSPYPPSISAGLPLPRFAQNNNFLLNPGTNRENANVSVNVAVPTPPQVLDLSYKIGDKRKLHDPDAPLDLSVKKTKPEDDVIFMGVHRKSPGVASLSGSSCTSGRSSTNGSTHSPHVVANPGFTNNWYPSAGPPSMGASYPYPMYHPEDLAAPENKKSSAAGPRSPYPSADRQLYGEGKIEGRLVDLMQSRSLHNNAQASSRSISSSSSNANNNNNNVKGTTLSQPSPPYLYQMMPGLLPVSDTGVILPKFAAPTNATVTSRAAQGQSDVVPRNVSQHAQQHTHAPKSLPSSQSRLVIQDNSIPGLMWQDPEFHKRANASHISRQSAKSVPQGTAHGTLVTPPYHGSARAQDVVKRADRKMSNAEGHIYEQSPLVGGKSTRSAMYSMSGGGQISAFEATVQSMNYPMYGKSPASEQQHVRQTYDVGNIGLHNDVRKVLANDSHQPYDDRNLQSHELNKTYPTYDPRDVHVKDAQRAYEARGVHVKDTHKAYDVRAVQVKDTHKAYDARAVHVKDTHKAYDARAVHVKDTHKAFDARAVHKAYDARAVHIKDTHKAYDARGAHVKGNQPQYDVRARESRDSVRNVQGRNYHSTAVRETGFSSAHLQQQQQQQQMHAHSPAGVRPNSSSHCQQARSDTGVRQSVEPRAPAAPPSLLPQSMSAHSMSRNVSLLEHHLTTLPGPSDQVPLSLTQEQLQQLQQQQQQQQQQPFDKPFPRSQSFPSMTLPNYQPPFPVNTNPLIEKFAGASSSLSQMPPGGAIITPFTAPKRLHGAETSASSISPRETPTQTSQKEPNIFRDSPKPSSRSSSPSVRLKSKKDYILEKTSSSYKYNSSDVSSPSDMTHSPASQGVRDALHRKLQERPSEGREKASDKPRESPGSVDGAVANIPHVPNSETSSPSQQGPSSVHSREDDTVYRCESVLTNAPLSMRMPDYNVSKSSPVFSSSFSHQPSHKLASRPIANVPPMRKSTESNPISKETTENNLEDQKVSRDQPSKPWGSAASSGSAARDPCASRPELAAYLMAPKERYKYLSRNSPLLDNTQHSAPNCQAGSDHKQLKMADIKTVGASTILEKPEVFASNDFSRKDSAQATDRDFRGALDEPKVITGNQVQHKELGQTTARDDKGGEKDSFPRAKQMMTKKARILKSAATILEVPVVQPKSDSVSVPKNELVVPKEQKMIPKKPKKKKVPTATLR